MGNQIQDSSKQTFTFVIETAKLTQEILLAVIKDYIDTKPEKTGRQSINALSGGHEENLKNITVTKNNLKDFEKTASKYGIKYAIKRDDTDKDNTKYLVMFQGKDLERVNSALQEYAYDKTNTTKARFSLQHMRELEKEVSQRTSPDKHKQKLRDKDRGEISH